MRELDKLWSLERPPGATGQGARTGRGATFETGSSLLGALFVLPASRDFPVEWAVVAHDEHARRAWVVAADSHPLVGVTDVEAVASEGGPITLRCRFATWLPQRRLREDLCTGQVAPVVVARAQRLLEKAVCGDLPGNVLQREDELDPTYHDWIDDVLRPAWNALGSLDDTLQAKLGVRMARS